MRVPWKARFLFFGLGLAGAGVAAWLYLPFFQDGLRALWGDAKTEVQERM